VSGKDRARFKGILHEEFELFYRAFKKWKNMPKTTLLKALDQKGQIPHT
jgi:hypothetical protein